VTASKSEQLPEDDHIKSKHVVIDCDFNCYFKLKTGGGIAQLA
jgi:hypothetical protein